MDDFEDEAGYAKPLTPEFIQKVNDTVCGVASDADIIVTTARIFGRPAPITVPSSAVKEFKSGAVVVDMNADVGGNCEDTVAGEVITTDNGVIVVGTSNLPGTIATTASMLYSNNLTTFITSLVDDGAIVISEEDDILVGAPEGSDFYVNGMGGVLICQNGEMHPKQTRLGGALNDPEFLIGNITLFVLAIFLGFELITKVPATLHTPLMSGANAISGISIIGALSVQM